MHGIVYAPVSVRKDQVTAPSHDLDDKTVRHGLVQLRTALEIKKKHPFKPRLRRLYEFCSRQMLSQKHTKIRRYRRVFFLCLCQMNA